MRLRRASSVADGSTERNSAPSPDASWQFPSPRWPPSPRSIVAAVGILEAQTAVWIALGIGVTTLGVQGARYAVYEHLGRARTLVSVVLNVLLGLVIVCLEVLVTH